MLKKAAPHMIKIAQQNEDIFTSNSVVFQVDQYVVFDCRAKNKTQIVSPRLYVIVLFTFSLICHLHMLYCTAQFWLMGHNIDVCTSLTRKYSQTAS